jgi:hypothetical protein
MTSEAGTSEDQCPALLVKAFADSFIFNEDFMPAKKFLSLLAIAAVICVLSVLTASAQQYNCPDCQRNVTVPRGAVVPPQFSIVTAPQPVFRAPLREAVYKFLTPQGHIVYGYYRGPVAPVSREQAIANAAYWQERARQLGGQ